MASLLGAPSGVQAASIDIPIPPGLVPAGEPAPNPRAPLQAAGEAIAGSTTPAKRATDILRGAAPAAPKATIPQAPRTSEGAAGSPVVRPAGPEAIPSESSSRPAARSAKAGSRARMARAESPPGPSGASAQTASRPLARALGTPDATGAEAVAGGPAGGDDNRWRIPIWPARMTDWVPPWPLVAAGMMLLFGGVGVRRLTAGA